MFRVTGARGALKKNQCLGALSSLRPQNQYGTDAGVPAQADVVVIGGGISGCATLYHLAKRGVKAVLLERAKVTSGTTWHSGGLCFRLRPNDTDIQILDSTRNLLMSLEQETGLNPGWTKNGSMFIAHTDERINEYKRLHTLGHFFKIESRLISPKEAANLSHILDPKKFKAALYSPGSGAADATMFCSALIKGAQARGAQVIENCPLTEFTVDQGSGVRKITGVETARGPIKTGCVVIAAGAWSRNIVQKLGLELPLTAMKHAYVVTDSIPEVRGSPNIRDHDYNIYYRIVGDNVMLGGYENNPEVIKEHMPDDFQFSLYDLNDSCFNVHMQNAAELTPAFGKVGIKSNVCGPESFTPDHKPLMGEDPRLFGLYHISGFNSMGIQLSGGCAEQLAIWVTQGRPELNMFAYDIRRFTQALRADRAWIVETSHESYVKNYSIVYPHDQPLAGRNHNIGPFQEVLVAKGAVMEQAQGWERPGYYINDQTAPVRGYDWYGNYDHLRNDDKRYEKQLEGDYTFGFSKHFDIIGEEAHAARTNCALFDLSSYTKMYLTGPDAREAADWLFTADTDKEPGRATYTCSLNGKGGVEADCTVTMLEEGVGTLVGPILKGVGFYIVAAGAPGNQTIAHFRKEMDRKKFKSTITDCSARMGILSVQGPKSSQLLQSITETPITDEKFPIGMSRIISVDGHVCRAMRVSMIGEMGYQLHVPVASCLHVYTRVMAAGKGFDLRLAGFRALDALACEKGYHLWNHDLRVDDNPIEAGLGKICRKEGPYLGKQHVDKLKQSGVKKRRAYFVLQDKVALHGLETIWRDDVIVGYLRRGNYGFSLNSSIGIGYVQRSKGQIVDDEFLKSGNYEIEVMDKRYPATLFIKSPFDPKNQRPLGQYEQEVEEPSHFED